MRLLTPDESHRACWGGPPEADPTDDPLVVPWNCPYILPELAAEVPHRLPAGWRSTPATP